MEKSQRDILILRPTPAFLSFLSEQLPDAELPELRWLQADPTAYTLSRQPSEEATLDELERHYQTIFRHEITRCVGETLSAEVDGGFLDFLCCFKFEFHSHMVLMESSLSEGQQLLCIKPRSVLLKWMRSSIEDAEVLTSVLLRINISALVENATVVVKNFKELSEVNPFVRQYFRPLFKAEMSRMCDKADQWPAVESFQTFCRYFSVEMHTQLIHI